MATDTDIETPVSSGATDQPDVPQESQSQLNDLARNKASVQAAGYAVQHPPKVTGLPAGMVVGPNLQTQSQIKGLPAGAVVGPTLTPPPVRPDFAQNPPPAAGGPPPAASGPSMSGETEGDSGGVGMSGDPEAQIVGAIPGLQRIAAAAPAVGSKAALTVAKNVGPAFSNAGAALNEATGGEPTPKVAVPSDEDFKKDHPIVAGLAESLGGTAGSIVGHPEYWPALAASGGPAVLRLIVEAGFAYDMSKSTIEGATELGSKWDTLSPEEKTKGVADLSQSATFAGLTGAAAGTNVYHGTVDVAGKFRDALTPKSQVTMNDVDGPVDVPTRPTGMLAKAAESRAPEVAKDFRTNVQGPAVAEGVSKTIQQGADIEGQHSRTTEDPFGLKSMSEGEKATYQGPVQRMDAIDNNAFSNAQEARARAKDNFTTEGKAEWKKQNQALTDLWDKHQPQLESEGYNVEEAKGAWARKAALDKIDQSMKATTALASDPTRPFDLKPGQTLGTTITRLLQNPNEPFKVLFGDKYEETKPILQNYARAWDEQSKIAGQNVSPMNKLMTAISTRVIGSVVGGVVGLAGGPVGAVAGGLAGEIGAPKLVAKLSQLYLGKILQTPELMKLMTHASTLGADPAIVGPKVNTIINNADPSWSAKTAEYMANLEHDRQAAAPPAANGPVAAPNQPGVDVGLGAPPDVAAQAKAEAPLAPVAPGAPQSQVKFSTEPGELVNVHKADILDTTRNRSGGVKAVETFDQPGTWTVQDAQGDGKGSGLKSYQSLLDNAQTRATDSGKPVTVRGGSVQSDSAVNAWKKLGNDYDVQYDKDGIPSVTFQPKTAPVTEAPLITPEEMGLKSSSPAPAVKEPPNAEREPVSPEDLLARGALENKPAVDIGAEVRAGEKGVPRTSESTERRARARTSDEEVQATELFRQARQKLGEGATSEQIGAEMDRRKSEYGGSNTGVTTDDYNEALKRLKSQRGSISNKPGESDLPSPKDLMTLGKYHFEALKNAAKATFEDWSTKMVSVLGDTVKPQLQELWNKLVVTAGGAKYEGVQEGAGKVSPQTLFTSKKTGSTLALDADKVTPEAVQAKLAAHELKWDSAEQAKVHNSNFDAGQGGSTFHPVDGNLDGKPFFAVGGESDFKDPALKMTTDGGTLTPRNMEDFRNRPEVQAALAKHTDASIGTWHDKETGKITTELVKTPANRAEAVAMGTRNGEKAIWDLKNHEEIPTGGDGEGGVGKGTPTPATPKPTTKVNHWTSVDKMDETDPAFHGTGKATGAETLRAKDPNYLPRTYFGEDGLRADGTPKYKEPVVQSQPNQYKGEIPTAKIYDLDDPKQGGDPNGVWQKALQKGTATDAENAIHDAGFSGYKHDGVIASFDKVPVTPVEKAQAATTVRPNGSTVELFDNPLKIKATGKGNTPLTTDVAMALNKYTTKTAKLAPLEFGKALPEAQMKRAVSLAEDEGRYGLAQNNGASTWYTEQMADHDRIMGEIRPELKDPTNLSIFKFNEAILSSGYDPYNNLNAALKSHDEYMKTGFFSPMNPETGKSWGPRGVNAYGFALQSLNNLIEAKGKQGAVDWMLSDHPVSELREAKVSNTAGSNIRGKVDDLQPGAMILGDKRGPFALNLHGREAAFTSDMWVNRTWNRWMGTTELGGTDKQGNIEISTEAPRNSSERALQKASFGEAAQKLGLSTSSLQAVLWYYEQALYTAHGVPKVSWSFSDAAARVAKEEAGRQIEKAATPTESEGKTQYGWRKPTAAKDTSFNTAGTGMASPEDEAVTHDYSPEKGLVPRNKPLT